MIINIIGSKGRFNFEDVFESKEPLKLQEFHLLHYILDKSGIIYNFENIECEKRDEEIQKVIDSKGKDDIVIIIDCHL